MKKENKMYPKYPNLFQPSWTKFGEDGEKIDSFKAEIPIYGTVLELIWGDKFHGLENARGGVQKVEGCVNSFLIVIRDKRQGTLVHELYHIVSMMTDELALSTDDIQEQQAYLIEYLYKEINKVVSS